MPLDWVTMDEFERDLLSVSTKLRNFAARLTKNAVEVDDLFQDTWVSCLEKRHTFQPGTNIRSWAFSVMYTRFIDRCRTDARKGIHVELDSVLGIGVKSTVEIEIACREIIAKFTPIEELIALTIGEAEDDRLRAAVKKNGFSHTNFFYKRQAMKRRLKQDFEDVFGH